MIYKYIFTIIVYGIVLKYSFFTLGWSIIFLKSMSSFRGFLKWCAKLLEQVICDSSSSEIAKCGVWLPPDKHVPLQTDDANTLFTSENRLLYSVRAYFRQFVCACACDVKTRIHFFVNHFNQPN